MYAFAWRYAATAVFLSSLLSWSPRTTSAETVNVGTTLYARRDLLKNWTEPEAARLRARKIVDRLLPTRIPDGPAFVRYFKLIGDKMKTIKNDVTRRQTMVTVADALGGYMYGVLLPTVKTAYYEGRADFDATDKLYGMMRKIKYTFCVRFRCFILGDNIIVIPSAVVAARTFAMEVRLFSDDYFRGLGTPAAIVVRIRQKFVPIEHPATRHR